MIPMRDGVRLATDIYLPCHGDGSLLEGEVPALLVRTSYDKTSSEWDDVIPYYVRRGYAFVLQDLAHVTAPRAMAATSTRPIHGRETMATTPSNGWRRGPGARARSVPSAHRIAR